MIHFYNILICLLSIAPRLYSLFLLGVGIAIGKINYPTMLPVIGIPVVISDVASVFGLVEGL